MKMEERIAIALENIAISLNALAEDTKADREFKQKIVEQDLQEITAKLEILKENFFNFDDSIDNGA